MITTAVSRPPLAGVALLAILIITAAWWTLALWPLEADAPQWLLRTREVCFGATHSGLPHAGGWLLLIGEPIGLVGLLTIVWGDELRDDLRRFRSTGIGRAAVVLVCVVAATGLFLAARRVAMAGGSDAEPFLVTDAMPARSDTPAPALELNDQLGERVNLSQFSGRWVIVTFAFGHCEDICPVIVEYARRARDDENASHIPILVVSLDPWRDTPDRLPGIADAWKLTGEDRVLSGSVAEVSSTLDKWNIGRQRDPDTGMITHGSTIVLVDPEGREAWRLQGSPQRIRQAIQLSQSAGSD